MAITKSEIKNLPQGIYICDIRYDEGIRIREDFISPCLHALQGGLLSNIPMILQIDVVKERD